MITPEQHETLKKIAEADNAKSMLFELMSMWGLQSAANANALLEEATKISTFMLEHKDNLSANLKGALDALLTADTFDHSDKKKYMLHILKICMGLFPMAEIEERHKPEEIVYFNELIQILHECSDFNASIGGYGTLKPEYSAMLLRSGSTVSGYQRVFQKKNAKAIREGVK